MNAKKHGHGLSPLERELVQSMQELEVMLQQQGASSSTNPETRQYITSTLNQMTNSLRQTALATKLVDSHLNYSLMADPVSPEERTKLFTEMLRVAEKVPPRLNALLRDKLMDKFGSPNKQFVYHLLNNIWLQVLLRWLQHSWGFSDDVMGKMKPSVQLLLIAEHKTSEEDLLKVIVRTFELPTKSSSPAAPEVMSELVDKMALAFAEVAPAEDAATGGVHGISLVK